MKIVSKLDAMALIDARRIELRGLRWRSARQRVYLFAECNETNVCFKLFLSIGSVNNSVEIAMDKEIFEKEIPRFYIDSRCVRDYDSNTPPESLWQDAVAAAIARFSNLKLSLWQRNRRLFIKLSIDGFEASGNIDFGEVSEIFLLSR